MKGKKDLREWWLKQLETLSIRDDVPTPQKMYQNLPNDLQQNVHDRGYWTIIKLAIHLYYLNLYLKVMRGEKQKRLFNRIAYVDTFAGPGIVRVKQKHFFYGSPLLSILGPKENKFNTYIFIEKEQGAYVVLERVLRNLEEQGFLKNVSWQIIKQDMNDVDYSAILSDFDHSLVFVDPEGIEPHFSTIEKIASHNCDLVLNYMDSGVKRLYNRTDILERFFCGNLTDLKGPADLFDRYLECIRKIRSEVKYINVRGLGSFGYIILFAVRKTKGGNPWFKALDNLKARVEQTQSMTFQAILEQFTGEQSIILDQDPNQ